ncbi:GNAT family protein [Acrocarpospora sp. B8E8]|uniref:GNAT family N-acetyltransferase n=1 Tax=Acrocarpospora sp. B8E8 TaxID=3153572 RepID=UPI00325DFCA5
MSVNQTLVSPVVVRMLAAEDEVRFLELANLSTGLHHPWVRLPLSPSEFADYLAKSDGVTTVCMVACRSEDGDLIGMVNINEIVRGPYQRGVLGYSVFLPYARQGYMSASVALVVRFAFDDLDLNRIEADIQPGNDASLNLVKRLGFRMEGFSPGYIKIGDTWRDHERWAITKQMDLSAIRG